MAMNELTLGRLTECGTLSRRTFPDIREKLLNRWLGQIKSGQLNVTFPCGGTRVFGGEALSPNVEIAIHDFGLVNKIARSGDLGLAESYIAGDWDTPHLPDALTLFSLNERNLADAARRSWVVSVLNRIRHARRANTRSGSRRNIADHYDLGNEFYGHWLDKTMTYSSALFESFSENHEDAQRRKYLRLAHTLGLKPGDHVLEIGCGWGGFSELAAREFGCTVTALTLSVEQANYARARVQQAGLSDRVDILLEDYRDIEGRFDKIVSIEMFEAVGEKNWPLFFDVLSQRLRPHGRAALQVISISDSVFDAYRKNPDFIQRYIFPGGMLPSPSAFTAAVSEAGLRISDAFTFGLSYAESLRRWDAGFVANWPKIEALGFDQHFCRMWRYYLAYCQVGFNLGLTDVGHYLIERT